MTKRFFVPLGDVRCLMKTFDLFGCPKRVMHQVRVPPPSLPAKAMAYHLRTAPPHRPIISPNLWLNFGAVTKSPSWP
jgi:hypothetical protein